MAPPEPFVGSRPLLNPTLPPFTTVVAAEGSTSMPTARPWASKTSVWPVIISKMSGSTAQNCTSIE